MFRQIVKYLLLALAFAIPFEHKYDKPFRYFSKTLIPQGMELPHFFDPKIYFYASDLISIFLTLGAIFFLKISARQLFTSRSAPYLWILFGLALISIFSSPMAHYPIPYIRLLQLLTPLLLFCLIANLYQNPADKIEITNAVFFVVMAAGIVQSIIGILQYTYESPLGLRLIGEINHFATFPSMGVEKWMLEAFFPRWQDAAQIFRASGTLPHTNVFAGFLCVSLLCSYALFFYYPKFKLWISLSIPLQLFAMFLAYSRSAVFSWTLATLFWFGYHILYRGYKIARKDRGLKMLGLTVALSVFLTVLILHEPLRVRGGFFNYQKTPAQYSDEGRIYYQDVALRIIQQHPWQGAGFNQLSLKALELTEKDEKNESWIGPHNIYIYLAAELGLPSLLFFLFFITSLFWAAFKAKYTPHIGSLMAIFLAFLFIGCCDFYPLLFQQGKMLLFLFAGLLAAHACYTPLSWKQPVYAAAPIDSSKPKHDLKK